MKIKVLALLTALTVSGVAVQDFQAPQAQGGPLIRLARAIRANSIARRQNRMERRMGRVSARAACWGDPRACSYATQAGPYAAVSYEYATEEVVVATSAEPTVAQPIEAMPVATPIESVDQAPVASVPQASAHTRIVYREVVRPRRTAIVRSNCPNCQRRMRW